MEILAVDAFSSSQLLVAGALALFVTIIFSSIYIRIKGQYRGRNKLPDHTQKKRVFGGRRTRDSHLPSIPPENHEVVSGARPKEPTKDDTEGFQFDFEIPERPRGPIEHVTPDQEEIARPDDRWEAPIEVGEGAFAKVTANGANGFETEERFEDEGTSVPEISYDRFVEAPANGVEERFENSDSDQQLVNSWETGDDDEYSLTDTEAMNADIDFSEDNGDSGFVAEEYQEDYEYEFVDDAVPSSTVEDYVPANDHPSEDDLATTNYEDHDVDHPIESESEEVVVPFDNRAAEAKRVGIPAEDTNRSFSVVSVCLISDDEGQIYRDIRGEILAAFLDKKGFIYLDEEYHLQHKSTVDKGAIRVRNYEATTIGSLVKGNMETCGFRLYFRPGDCADPLATLNEMLKIANLAISFFSNVCEKPLVIYDGRKDSTGNISRLTQEDYDALKRELYDAFPRSLGTGSKRTAITRNEYAPSDDLPTRAEQI